MYLEIIGSVLILGSSTYAGWLHGERYRKRLESLREWKKILRMIEGEMRYRKVPLGDVFAHVKAKTSGAFSDWLSWLASMLEGYSGKTFRQLWEEGIDVWLTDGDFTGEDIAMMKELGNQMGYLDIRMQESVINQAVVQVETKISMLEQSLSEKQKISRMLGVSIGIFCVVLLV